MDWEPLLQPDYGTHHMLLPFDLLEQAFLLFLEADKLYIQILFLLNYMTLILFIMKNKSLYNIYLLNYIFVK